MLNITKDLKEDIHNEVKWKLFKKLTEIKYIWNLQKLKNLKFLMDEWNEHTAEEKMLP